ncbi:unnamed protein product [Lampetra planeri]
MATNQITFERNARRGGGCLRSLCREHTGRSASRRLPDIASQREAAAGKSVIAGIQCASYESRGEPNELSER